MVGRPTVPPTSESQRPDFQSRRRESDFRHCVSKNIPDIFDRNLKTNYRILIIFGNNISDTTCHQMTVQFPTSLNVIFCTT